MTLDATHDLAPVTTMALVDADDMHNDMMDVLRAILRELTDDGLTVIGPFSTSAASQSNTISTHIRLRVRTILATVDSAATVLRLNVGSTFYPFTQLNGVLDVSFPIVIERGTDLSFTAVGGATMHAYLICRPE